MRVFQKNVMEGFRFGEPSDNVNHQSLCRFVRSGICQRTVDKVQRSFNSFNSFNSLGIQ